MWARGDRARQASETGERVRGHQWRLLIMLVDRVVLIHCGGMRVLILRDLSQQLHQLFRRHVQHVVQHADAVHCTMRCVRRSAHERQTERTR